MERREVYTLGVAIVIVIGGTGMLGVLISQPRTTPADEFIFEVGGEPSCMDPHVNYYGPTSDLHFNIYETLYTYPWGSNNTEPTVPLLAAAPPVISTDGTQYNITLRQGITFHDGTQFNASCVKWNIERAVKIFALGPVWMIIEPLKGGEALEAVVWNNGTQSDEFETAFNDWQANSGAVVVLDTYTIQFNLERPFAPFIPAMTYEVAAFMSPTYVLSNPNNDTGPMDSHWGVDYGEAVTWMETHVCGTGPYKLEDWRPNEFLKMVLYEDYWRAEATEAAIAPPEYAGSLKVVFSRCNEQLTSRLMNLRIGMVDRCYWPTTHASDIWDNVTGGSKFPDIHVSSGGISYGVFGFAFSLRQINITRDGVSKIVASPFIFRELRKCFAYAFNYQILVESVIKGWGVQAKGFLPYGMFGHDPSCWQEHYDIDEAVLWWNLAMNETGFVDAINAMEGYLDLDYVYEDEYMEQTGLLMKDGFAQVMNHPDVNTTGIVLPEVKLQSLLPRDFRTKRIKGELLVSITAWAPDYSDPDNFAMPFAHSQGQYNQWNGYGNDTVDDWIVQAKQSTNATERLELYSKIQKQVAYDQPGIFVYQPKEFRVWRTWLRGSGLAWNPMHGLYWYHLFKDYGS